jgi:hypothetical protein
MEERMRTTYQPTLSMDESLMKRMEEDSHLLEDGISKLAVVYSGTEGSRLWVMPARFAKALSALVWIMVLFTDFSLFFLVTRGHVHFPHGIVVLLLTQLTLWAHLKTMLTNPGTVPINAQPLLKDRNRNHCFCPRCKCYKPPRSHHGEYLRALSTSVYICLAHKCDLILSTLPRPNIQSVYITHGPLLPLDQ